jgi:hypothetical protein
MASNFDLENRGDILLPNLGISSKNTVTIFFGRGHYLSFHILLEPLINWIYASVPPYAFMA